MSVKDSLTESKCWQCATPRLSFSVQQVAQLRLNQIPLKPKWIHILNTFGEEADIEESRKQVFYSSQLPRNAPVMHPKWSLYTIKVCWCSRPHYTWSTVSSHWNKERKS